MTHLELQDKIVDFDDLTFLKSHDLFKITESSTSVRTNLADENQVIELGFVMNPDLHVIERSGYSLLDLLSDIGGVQGILQSFFSLLVGILNYDYLSDSLASRLYKYKQSNNH